MKFVINVIDHNLSYIGVYDTKFRCCGDKYGLLSN